MSSAKVVDGRLAIALVGPPDTTFQVRMGGVTVGCIARKGPLDAKAAKGLTANSVQHYAVECGQNGDTDGKKQTLLVTVKMVSGNAEFTKPLTVTS